MKIQLKKGVQLKGIFASCPRSVLEEDVTQSFCHHSKKLGPVSSSYPQIVMIGWIFSLEWVMILESFRQILCQYQLI
jgi:hypothetical protein